MTITQPNAEKYYTVRELEGLLSVSRSTIDRLVKKGVLTRFKFGSKTLFSAVEIQALIVAQKI